MSRCRCGTPTGRGTVVTGVVESGGVRVGDPVEAVGLGLSVSTVVTGVETFGQTMDRAQAGDRLTMTVELGRPVALDRGLGFVVREGGKTVGAGTVLSVLS
jgi:elongation factor Tu